MWQMQDDVLRSPLPKQYVSVAFVGCGLSWLWTIYRVFWGGSLALSPTPLLASKVPVVCSNVVVAQNKTNEWWELAHLQECLIDVRC